MSPRDWKFRLTDISDAIERIEEYVKGLDYVGWQRDIKTIDAVIRNLEVIGEAAVHIPEDFQEEYSQVPWSKMKAMRNVLIHEYFGVDIEVLWKTIQEDIPSLKEKLRELS